MKMMMVKMVLRVPLRTRQKTSKNRDTDDGTHHDHQGGNFRKDDNSRSRQQQA